MRARLSSIRGSAYRENVQFAAPGASVAHLRTFAEEVMPAFGGDPLGLAQV